MRQSHDEVYSRGSSILSGILGLAVLGGISFAVTPTVTLQNQFAATVALSGNLSESPEARPSIRDSKEDESKVLTDQIPTGQTVDGKQVFYACKQKSADSSKVNQLIQDCQPGFQYSIIELSGAVIVTPSVRKGSECVGATPDSASKCSLDGSSPLKSCPLDPSIPGIVYYTIVGEKPQSAGTCDELKKMDGSGKSVLDVARARSVGLENTAIALADNPEDWREATERVGISPEMAAAFGEQGTTGKTLNDVQAQRENVLTQLKNFEGCAATNVQCANRVTELTQMNESLAAREKALQTQMDNLRKESSRLLAGEPPSLTPSSRGFDSPSGYVYLPGGEYSPDSGTTFPKPPSSNPAASGETEKTTTTSEESSSWWSTISKLPSTITSGVKKATEYVQQGLGSLQNAYKTASHNALVDANERAASTYTGTNIIEYCRAAGGIDCGSDGAFRKRLVELAAYSEYQPTAAGNTELLKRLRSVAESGPPIDLTEGEDLSGSYFTDAEGKIITGRPQPRPQTSPDNDTGDSEPERDGFAGPGNFRSAQDEGIQAISDVLNPAPENEINQRVYDILKEKGGEYAAAADELVFATKGKPDEQLGALATLAALSADDVKSCQTPGQFYNCIRDIGLNPSGLSEENANIRNVIATQAFGVNCTDRSASCNNQVQEAWNNFVAQGSVTVKCIDRTGSLVPGSGCGTIPLDVEDVSLRAEPTVSELVSAIKNKNLGTQYLLLDSTREYNIAKLAQLEAQGKILESSVPFDALPPSVKRNLTENIPGSDSTTTEIPNIQSSPVTDAVIENKPLPTLVGPMKDPQLQFDLINAKSKGDTSLVELSLQTWEKRERENIRNSPIGIETAAISQRMTRVDQSEKAQEFATRVEDLIFEGRTQDAQQLVKDMDNVISRVEETYVTPAEYFGGLLSNARDQITDVTKRAAETIQGGLGTVQRGLGDAASFLSSEQVTDAVSSAIEQRTMQETAIKQHPTIKSIEASLNTVFEGDQAAISSYMDTMIANGLQTPKTSAEIDAFLDDNLTRVSQAAQEISNSMQAVDAERLSRLDRIKFIEQASTASNLPKRVEWPDAVTESPKPWYERIFGIKPESQEGAQYPDLVENTVSSRIDSSGTEISIPDNAELERLMKIPSTHFTAQLNRLSDFDPLVESTISQAASDAQAQITYGKDLLARANGAAQIAIADTIVNEGEARLREINYVAERYRDLNPTQEVQDVIDRIVAEDTKAGDWAQAFSLGAESAASKADALWANVKTEGELSDVPGMLWYGGTGLVGHGISGLTNATKNVLGDLGFASFKPSAEDALYDAIDPIGSEWRTLVDVAGAAPVVIGGTTVVRAGLRPFVTSGRTSSIGLGNSAARVSTTRIEPTFGDSPGLNVSKSVPDMDAFERAIIPGLNPRGFNLDTGAFERAIMPEGPNAYIKPVDDLTDTLNIGRIEDVAQFTRAPFTPTVPTRNYSPPLTNSPIVNARVRSIFNFTTPEPAYTPLDPAVVQRVNAMFGRSPAPTIVPVSVNKPGSFDPASWSRVFEADISAISPANSNFLTPIAPSPDLFAPINPAAIQRLNSFRPQITPAAE